MYGLMSSHVYIEDTHTPIDAWSRDVIGELMATFTIIVNTNCGLVQCQYMKKQTVALKKR